VRDFHVKRKIQGISADLAAEAVGHACFSHDKTDGYGEIPYALVQGIFLGKEGTILAEQGTPNAKSGMENSKGV
jgi:hypothetical protein